MKLTKSSISLLSEIITATDSDGSGFVVMTAPATKQLIDAGFIETNAEITNERGETAARVSEKGRHYATTGEGLETGNAGEGNSTSGDTAPAPRRRSFAIDDNVPLVEKVRAPVAEMYPFGKLEIGQSFFVADDEVKGGSAYKTLSSTVTTANKKYSEETGEFRQHRRDHAKQVAVVRQLRQFELRYFTAEIDGVEVPGARVYRVQVGIDA